jgi:hypothetical protein
MACPVLPLFVTGSRFGPSLIKTYKRYLQIQQRVVSPVLIHFQLNQSTGNTGFQQFQVCEFFDTYILERKTVKISLESLQN